MILVLGSPEHLGHTLVAMIVVHLLLDYPLQGDFLAKAKHHINGVNGVPWIHGLMAHSILQGAGVWAVTGTMTLGFLEMIAHAIIDYGKNAGWYQPVRLNSVSAIEGAYHVDQALHVLCKLLWLLIIIVSRR